MNNILVNDVGAEVDAITSLRAPTYFGRPNVSPSYLSLTHAVSLPPVADRDSMLTPQWDRVFESIADKHPDTDCGVFFCGPTGLGETLKGMSNKYTSPMGCRFFFGKEVSQARGLFKSRSRSIEKC
jgi:hypothetical protein